jgi:putative transcriptional regulator
MSETETACLTNHFLIAMPQLDDPNFHHTASYVCEHNDEGAMGLIINRPMELTLDEVLDHMEIQIQDRNVAQVPVYFGGPVQPERGFVLHTTGGEWEATLKITDDISLTTSRDIIEKIAEGGGPEQFLIALGYAGWGAGQLEQEIAETTWLNGPADTRILFELPSEERWSAAAAAIGVDLNLLSSDAGHA